MTAAEVMPADTAPPTVWTVPLSKLVPAKDNPRVDLGDLEELADSIASVGIVQPLIVTPGPAGRFLIVAGHRRHAAAQLAVTKHGAPDTVPVIARQYSEEERQEVMLVENLQRQDLSPFEEAAGFAALVKIGRSQRAIADRVGCTQPHVSKRLKLLELPEAVRNAVEDKDSRWSIEDALHLTKLADHPKDLLEVFKDCHGNNVKWYVDNRLGKIADAEKRTKVRAELEKMQLRIVDVDSYASGSWVPLDDGARPVGEKWSHGLLLDVTKHEREACSATALLADGRTVPICTDPARHEGVKTAPVGGVRPGSAQASKPKEPTPEELHRQALRDARPTRLAAAKKAVQAKTKTTADAAWQSLTLAVSLMLNGETEIYPDTLLMAELLDRQSADLREDLRVYATSSREALVRTVTAVYVDDREAILQGLAWNRPDDVWPDEAVAYLAWLKKHAGYEPSAAEQVELDKARWGAGVTDLEELTRAAAAEVRGHATDVQRELLAGDVESWLDGLREILVDIERQEVRNAAECDRVCREHPAIAEAERDRLVSWRARTATFRGRVERRIAALEHDVEVRRRRRLEEAHRAVSAAAFELLDDAPDQLDLIAATDGVVPVPADAVLRLADAFARLEDAATGAYAPVLAGAHN